MKYFLAKTDPQTYSIDDLAKEKETLWDGVHSFAALRYIEMMNINDLVFIYHSQGESSIVGLAKVVSTPRENVKDPRKSFVVDMKFIKKYENPVKLKEIKESHLFDDWALVRQGRLSIMDVPDAFVQWLKKKGFNIE